MRRLLLILGLIVALGGCITPSIPIPPPDPALMSFVVTSDGNTSSATFEYPANDNYANAIVFVFNRDRGVGVIETARSNGSVGPTAPVAAALGEQIVISFQRDDQTVSTCVRLRQGSQSATDYCGP
ncbi:MAG: hypothetical protein ACTHU0_35205 [Kofleriaceae bacterium]